MMERMSPKYAPCPRCGSTQARRTPDFYRGGHHAKKECAECGRWLKWVGKPEVRWFQSVSVRCPSIAEGSR